MFASAPASVNIDTIFWSVVIWRAVFKIVSMLIAAGADANIQNDEGESAAMSSLKKQSQKAKEELTKLKNADKENWSKHEKANEDRELAAQELVKSTEKKYKEFEPENVKLKAQVESLTNQLTIVKSAKSSMEKTKNEQIASKNEEIIKLKSQLEIFKNKANYVSTIVNQSITEMIESTQMKGEYHEEEDRQEIKPVAKKIKLPAAKKMKLSDALQKISAGDVNDNLDSNFEEGISLDPIIPPVRSIRAKKR